MRKLWPGVLFGVSAASIVFVVVACTSSEDLPPAAANGEGRDAGAGTAVDAAKGDGGDASSEGGLPASCSSTTKDGLETDVDCGGTECAKCIDGKACVAPTDCAGGSCVANKCVTAACNDVFKNGAESDTDCGGDTCAKCTFGRSCSVASDCVSGSCVNLKCACPTGMATVPRAGGSYCIDQAEITKGQYDKFVAAGVKRETQDPVCQTNDRFEPRGAWPPAQTPSLAYNNSLPVHYVDWCDAVAYCKWAGKQLCGQINGGTLAPAQADLPDAGAWYNACSAQGGNRWPYSAVFDVSRCNGAGDGGGVGYGFGGANQDLGVYQVATSDGVGNIQDYVNKDCQGGATSLYQMSGNVGEWEDSCDGAGANANCRVRGGSFRANNDQTALACAATRTVARLPAPGGDPDQDPLRDIGIRCCLY